MRKEVLGILALLGLFSHVTVASGTISPASGVDHSADGTFDSMQQTALDYTERHFRILSGELQTALVRILKTSELSSFGLMDWLQSDEDTTLVVVVIGGDLGLIPWWDSSKYDSLGPDAERFRVRYIAYIFHPRSESLLAWQASRRGGSFRTLLSNPDLPDDHLSTSTGMSPVSPPGLATLPPPGRRPGQPVFPGQGNYSVVPPSCAETALVTEVDTCGVMRPTLCDPRSAYFIPTVCGTTGPMQYVRLHIDERGVQAPEITVPVGTQVTWVNDSEMPVAIAPVGGASGGWGSGPITPAGRWSVIFNLPGAYDYAASDSSTRWRGRLTVTSQ